MAEQRSVSVVWQVLYVTLAVLALAGAISVVGGF